MTTAKDINDLKIALMHAACSCGGDINIDMLNALCVECKVDRPWMIAAAWELVEDGWASYGADGVFHVIR